MAENTDGQFSIHKNKSSELKRSVPGRVAQSDSKARGPGFDTGSVHILSFLVPPIQEEQFPTK